MFQESRYRLAWMVCLLLLIGFVANSISNYMVSRHNVRKTITESSLPLTSDNIYSVIQRDLLQPIFISSMMGNDAFLREWTIAGEKDIAPIQRYLNEIVREYNTVTSFFVSENTRNYYYAGGLLKQVSEDEPRDEWYFRVRDDGPGLTPADQEKLFKRFMRLTPRPTGDEGSTGLGLYIVKKCASVSERRRWSNPVRAKAVVLKSGIRWNWESIKIHGQKSIDQRT